MAIVPLDSNEPIDYNALVEMLQDLDTCFRYAPSFRRYLASMTLNLEHYHQMFKPTKPPTKTPP